jgi:hypothetical protein
MSALVVVPCLPVGRAEIAEARRALAGQARLGLSDATIARGLWVARAMPAVLDVMGASGLLHCGFAGVDVAAAPTASTAPLSLVAWRRDEEPVVEALALHDDDLAQRRFEEPICHLLVGLRRPKNRRAPTDLHDDDDPVIRLQRFSFGARGKTS